MKFGGMGLPELLLIAGIALLIFGPKNLPKLGKSLGKTVKSVREGMDGKFDEDESAPAAPAAPSEKSEDAGTKSE